MDGNGDRKTEQANDDSGPETVSSDSAPNSQLVTAASSSPPVSSEGNEVSGAATSDQDPVEALRIQLVGLELLTPQQWAEAVRRCGGTSDVHRILQELQQVPSHRDPRGGGTIPALTSFQVEQILAGNTERLRLQHYVVVERLGAGGMGEVFKAWNLNLERLEAIKTIIQVDADGGTSSSTQGLARFEREARVLAQLDHECITTIYHAGREHGLAFIAMEYVSGDNMKDIVDSAFAEGDPVPVWWAVERAMAIASALEHAHSKSVIHRDVKPSNIMITEKGELKVLDMGIARLARPQDSTGGTSRLTQSQTGLGTPEVMPPEQWADAAAVTPASDIYSLGCTLFYMLTGRMPFEANSLQGYMFAHVNDTPPKPSSLRKEIPSGLDRVVLKMLAKDPDSRYTNCADLVAALAPFSSSAKRDGREEGGGLLGMATSKTTLAAAAGCLLVAVVSGVVWMVSQWTPAPRPEEETPEDPKVIAEVPERQEPVIPTVNARNELDGWLAEHQEQHAKVWPSLEELKKFTYAGQENVIAPDLREALLEKVQAETASRWQNEIDAALQDIQKKHPEIWKDVDELEQFASLIKPLSEVQSTEAMDLLLRKIDRETWKRKVDNWIAEFQMLHSHAWKTRKELQDFVSKEFPDDSNDSSYSKGFNTIENRVRLRTQELINKEKDNWLVTLQKENPAVWPDIEELRNQAALRIDQVTDDESLEVFQNTIKGLTNGLKNPFEGINTDEIRDQGERYRVKSLLESYRWLLSLPQEAKDPNWDFELRFTVEGRTIPEDELRFPIDKQVQIEINPKQEGYVTMFFLSSGGSHLLLRSCKAILAEREEKYLAGEWQLVALPTTDTPGVDKFVIYFTDIDPFKVVSEPVPLPMQRAEEDLGRHFTETRFFIAREKEGGQLNEFKTLFKDPLIFERMEKKLAAGQQYPTIEPDQRVKHWNVKAFEIEVIRP